MCEICKKAEGFGLFEIGSISFGDGVKATAEIVICEEGSYIELTKNISEDNRNWIELPKMTKSLDIKYCPVCGRKL